MFIQIRIPTATDFHRDKQDLVKVRGEGVGVTEININSLSVYIILCPGTLYASHVDLNLFFSHSLGLLLVKVLNITMF